MKVSAIQRRQIIPSNAINPDTAKPEAHILPRSRAMPSLNLSVGRDSFNALLVGSIPHPGLGTTRY